MGYMLGNRDAPIPSMDISISVLHIGILNCTADACDVTLSVYPHRARLSFDAPDKISGHYVPVTKSIFDFFSRTNVRCPARYFKACYDEFSKSNIIICK
jgi:hypothetical protein